MAGAESSQSHLDRRKLGRHIDCLYSQFTGYSFVLQIFFIPSILLAGMMFPYEMLPEAVGKIAQLLPATQAMNAFKGLAMGGVVDFNPWGSVIALFASGLLAFGVAIFLFSWDSRNTAQRGHPLLALLFLLPYVIMIFVGWANGYRVDDVIGMGLQLFLN